MVLRNLLGRRPLGQMNQLRSKMNTIIEWCHLFSTKVATARHVKGQLESRSFFTGPRWGSDSATGSTWIAIRNGPREGIEMIAQVCGLSIGESGMIRNGMRPVHPGEVLLRELMRPPELLVKANRLAKAIDAPANQITAMTKRQRGITGRTAVSLATVSIPLLISGRTCRRPTSVDC